LHLARSGAVALTTFLAVMAPTAAQAKSYVHADTSGDVVQLDQNPSSNSSTKVPAHADGDIVRSAVVHGKRRVTMAISYRDLVAPSTSSDVAVHLFRIGTSKHRIRSVFVVASSTRPRGAVGVEKADGKAVTCRGVRWDIDYSTKTVRTSVPRRCLGNPRWVHVGMGAINEDEPTFFADDAATNGYLGENPKWGPRVYR
jgi:hypothetical protein